MLDSVKSLISNQWLSEIIQKICLLAEWISYPIRSQKYRVEILLSIKMKLSKSTELQVSTRWVLLTK